MDNNKTEKPNQIVMADDGKGGQVTIPTVLISESDGEQILKYVEEGVVLSVTFETVVRERAELQLWVDILNHNNFIFLRNFQTYFKRIQAHGTPVSIQSTSLSATRPTVANNTAVLTTATTIQNTAATPSTSGASRTAENRS